MNQPKSTNTLLDDHRNMVMVSKKISDFQENNLKNWVNIVFDDVEQCKIKYNFDKGEKFHAGKIEFDFYFKKDKEPTPEKKERSLRDLETWVQNLFWSDTKVVFKLKGKKWT